MSKDWRLNFKGSLSEFDKRFKKQSTPELIKGYASKNSDYRKITRDELKKRRELGKLKKEHGYSRKKRRSSGFGFSMQIPRIRF